MMVLGLFLLALVLLILRQNLVAILGLTLVIAYTILDQGDPGALMLDAWHALNQEILLAIPLFLLVGQIVSQGTGAERMVRLMRALTRPIPGGLAVAAVLACAIFAAVSGSGIATLLAIGTVMYPALVKAGYDKSFAIGALCSAGTLGIVIPPSIPLILYGFMTQTSIAALFLAGLLPGLMLTGLISGYAYLAHRHLDIEPIDWPEVGHALRGSLAALSTPVIVLGGIYSGYFTATEAAVVGVVYAGLIELAVHRDLKITELPDLLGKTAVTLGTLFPVLMFAFCLNTLLMIEGTPQMLVDTLVDWFAHPVMFILATNLMLLVVGTVMDIGSAILLLAPLLNPLAQANGMDPVHFGIMMVVNLEIGYLTPPLGLNLIVAAAIFRESFWFVCRAVLPFLGLMVIGLFLVAAFPQISLFLVERF